MDIAFIDSQDLGEMDDEGHMLVGTKLIAYTFIFIYFKVSSNFT